MSKGKSGGSGAWTKSKKNAPKKNASPTKKNDTPANTDSSTTNRPRNFYVTDANHPFKYSFQGRFGVHQSIQVHQTAADASWPGGALWDLGVLLSHTILGLAGLTQATTTTTVDSNDSATTTFKSKHLAISFRTDTLCPTLSSSQPPSWISDILLNEHSMVVELGCGVGLTGLVMAAVARPSLLLLTDLAVVIDHVTYDNLQKNSKELKTSQRKRANKTPQATSSTSSSSEPSQQHNFRLIGQTPCLATPLCWGDEQDLQRVQDILTQHRKQQHKSTTTSSSTKKKKKQQPHDKKSSTTPSAHQQQSTAPDGTADVILLGDVAYQHAPGAPSHFEALVETVVALCHPHTILVFGTRVRMPASHDLLWLLQQHMEALVDPPLAADEVDPSFRNVKHNMHIHFLRLKKRAIPEGEGQL